MWVLVGRGEGRTEEVVEERVDGCYEEDDAGRDVEQACCAGRVC